MSHPSDSPAHPPEDLCPQALQVDTVPTPDSPPLATSRIHQLRAIGSVQDFLDFAVQLPESHIDKAVAKLHRKYPQASVEQLIEIVSQRYIHRSGIASAGVGGTAAIPGTGLVAGSALSVGEVAAFALSTSLYVLTVARLVGIPTRDLATRRTLILSAILGEDAVSIVADQIGLGLWNWVMTQAKHITTPTLNSVNQALARYAGKKLAKKLSGHVIGRVIPLGIGAAIGYFSGRKLAYNTVKGVKRQLSLMPTQD